MSDAGQSGAGRREVAYRLFAAEFEDADFSYSESDEERAPNYVVTPTGARVNRLFVVGVLTEVEAVSDDVLRARVVDPTGAFVLYAGQYQPDERAFLDGADTPSFVALTGKARTFQPEDSDRVFTSVRPESISDVDASTRDRWSVQAAEQTLQRVGHAATALALDLRGEQLRAALEDRGVDEGLAEGIALAIDHYDTSPAYLRAVREMALDVARLVAGELDEVDPVSVRPDEPGEADLESLAGAGVDALADADVGRETAGDTDSAPPSGGESEEETGVPSDAGSTVSTADDEGVAGAETPAASGTEETGRAAESEQAGGEADSGTATEAADGDESATSGGESPADVGDFESEFELDEEEREELAEEYGTEFQAGTDVDEPGEADIETPTPEESPGDAGTTAEPAATERSDAGTGAPETEAAATATTEGTTDGATGDEPPQDAGTSAAESEPTDVTAEAADDLTGVEADEPAVESTGEELAAADGDLEDAVVEAMERLDEGEGASREAVVETVLERYGAGRDDVEAAIQDALMDGRCYEPDDTTLKPI